MRTLIESVLVHARVLAVAFTAACWLAACGGGSGPQYGDAPVYSYPAGGKSDYNNAFEGVDGSRMIKMFLFRDGSSQSGPSGKFDTAPNSRISYSSGSFHNLTDYYLTDGTFDSNGFRFTAASIKYTGKFLADDLVELTVENGSTYVLTRNSGPQANAHVADTWTLSKPTARLLQLGPTNGSLDEDATLQLAGTEFQDDGSTASVSGWANVDRVSLTVRRSSGDVLLQGQFGRNASGYLFDSLTFSDGTEFHRGGTPDAQRAVFFATSSSGGSELRDVDLKGVQRKTLLSIGSGYIPRFSISPDKAYVAVIVQDVGTQRGELSVIDRATGARTAITNLVAGGGDVLDVDWSPDSQQLAYVAQLNGSSAATLYVDRRQGGAPVSIQGTVARRTASPTNYSVRWSRSGNFILFKGNVESADGFGLYAAKPNFAGVRTIWSSTHGDASSFVWAPSGDRLALVSQVASELWIIDVANAYATGTTPLNLVSQDVRTYAWSADSSALAFNTGSFVGKIVAASGLRTTLADAASAPSGLQDNIYWAPDNVRLAFLPVNGGGWVVSDGSARKILGDDGAEGCATASQPPQGSPVLGWSPDSTRVAYLTLGTSGLCHLAAFDIAANQRRLISQDVKTPQAALSIRWLSDSRRVAFVANVELDRFEDGLDDLLVADWLGTVALKVSDPLLGAVSVFNREYEMR